MPLRICRRRYHQVAHGLLVQTLCAAGVQEDHADHVADIEAELGIEVDRAEHHGACALPGSC